jgi:erythromycin esterase-like protein
MWKPFERARVKFQLPRVRYSKLGITGVVSLLVVGLILVAGGLLDLRGGGNREEVQRFGTYAGQAKQDPVEAIVAGGRAHRFVFLSDIHGSTETKRLATRVVEALANGPGLDAVVLEVGRDQQTYIDRYFDASVEDASVLLSHPRTLRDPGSATRDYLELYHRIWLLNEKLGADRRINVIAADLEGWPDERAVSPTERARRFAQRDEAMAQNLERAVLGSSTRSRLLVFTTGLHALKRGQGLLQSGGSAPVEAQWLAARLEQRYPGEVYSALVDAPGSGSQAVELVPYNGTRIPKAAESVMPPGRYALPVNDAFDFVSRPVQENGMPGLHFEIAPRNYRMKDVSDLYVYLGR